jgi:phospholipid/cholesterol/gamma-HCH transport system substrate-binding protein
VSQQLAGEKTELAAALGNLAGVLGKVERFVKGNRQALTDDVGDLARILKVVAGEKDALEAVLDVGPSAMNNLAIAFDPKSGTIGSRLNFQGNVQDLDNLLCMMVRNAQIPEAAQACSLFKTLLQPIEDQTQLPISAPAAPPAQGGTREVRYGSSQPASTLTELLGGTA